MSGICELFSANMRASSIRVCSSAAGSRDSVVLILLSIYAIERPRFSGAYVSWCMHFSKRQVRARRCRRKKRPTRGAMQIAGVERASGVLILLTSRQVVHRPGLKVLGAHAASCRMSWKYRLPISSTLQARAKAVPTGPPVSGQTSWSR